MHGTPSACEPRCWRVNRTPDGRVTGGVAPLAWDVTGPDAAGDVTVRVEAAGFNYKDALACSGHPGVMRVPALVPGIDAAGWVVRGDGLAEGMAVVVTGNQMGESRDGGFATHLRIPAAALIPRPAALSAVDAMALGTAGLTVLLACDRLAMLVDPRHARPGEEWLVTGASGGVGMIAVALLAAAGHTVVASSRKPEARAPLETLGATTVVTPEEIVDPTPKSLVRGRFAGVIDTVGGRLLADVLRAVRPGGAVAAVGMAGGADLLTSVHPFILRGVTLAGIDVATLPTQAERERLWQRLAALWPMLQGRLPVATMGLAAVGGHAERMLAGRSLGRGVVLPDA